MADYNINAVTRRVVYTGSAGLGPYAFSFEVLNQTDIVVYFNTTKLTLTTDYTVSVNANGTGSVTIVTGTNVPTTPDADDNIIIVGARDIERVTDFVTAGEFRAAAINEQLDSLTIFDQQVAEEQKRSLAAPVYDPAHVDDGGTLDMTLPAKATRATKVLAFDSDGNPTASTSTLSAIESGATDAATSATAAANSATEAAASAASVSTAAAYAAAYVDNYAAGVDFTAGSSTTITLTQSVNDEKYVHIYFDGVHQHHNTYTVSGGTVTFDAAIPTGVTNIEAAYGIRTSVPLNGIHDLTTAEVDQLENIGSSTISAAQWGYVGNLNQDLASDDNVTFNNVTVAGDLTINGSTVQLDVTNLEIDDNLILVNNGVAAGSNANDAGILIERGSTGDNAVFVWDESADAFIVGTTTATGGATGNLTITAAPFTAAAITGTTITGVNTSSGAEADVLFVQNAATATGTAGTIKFVNSTAAGSNSGSVEFSAVRSGTSTGKLIIRVANSSGSMVDELVFDGAVGTWDFQNNPITTTGTITFNGGTTSADLNFGDNDKAIFGAGSDLQIYHDGGNSIIRDTGTGGLFLMGSSNVYITNNGASANFFAATEGAEVSLFYNNSAKLATTNTGIDVTGDVGGDTATITGSITSNPASGANILFQNGSGAAVGRVTFDSTNLKVRGDSSKGLKLGSNGSDVIEIDTSGNVGIGTTPSYILDVAGASANVAKFKRSSAGTTEVLIDTSGSGDAQLVFADNGTDSWAIGRDNSNGDFVISASGALGTSNVINIESGGNVGIGTTSPGTTLECAGSITANPASGANILFENGSGAAVGRVTFDSTNLKMRGDSGKGLKLGSDGSDVVTIDTSGGTTFSGVVTVNSNIVANQISFDSGSNYLDDYEEGTWTPTLSGATTTTYTAQSGDYTKIGNFVFVNCSLQINSVGDGSTTTIAGLPYASNLAGSASAGGSVSYFANSAVTTLTISPELGDGASTLRFRGLSSTSSGFSGYLAMFQNSTRVDFHLVYKAT